MGFEPKVHDCEFWSALQLYYGCTYSTTSSRAAAPVGIFIGVGVTSRKPLNHFDRACRDFMDLRVSWEGGRPFIYIYIYIYMYVCIYIYIYMHILSSLVLWAGLVS